MDERVVFHRALTWDQAIIITIGRWIQTLLNRDIQRRMVEAGAEVESLLAF